ncbi:MAG: hypothetical protein M0007_07520, partial [Actinomycetota bacterium]|nr:hypothetical protein [Actinomycetota bacterium]
ARSWGGMSGRSDLEDRPSAPPPLVDESGEDRLSDEELTALALSERFGDQPSADAVPLTVYLGRTGGPLPAWYMPAPAARVGSRWRAAVVLGLVGLFFVIEALGLCTAYGHLVVG